MKQLLLFIFLVSILPSCAKQPPGSRECAMGGCKYQLNDRYEVTHIPPARGLDPVKESDDNFEFTIATEVAGDLPNESTKLTYWVRDQDSGVAINISGMLLSHERRDDQTIIRLYNPSVVIDRNPPAIGEQYAEGINIINVKNSAKGDAKPTPEATEASTPLVQQIDSNEISAEPDDTITLLSDEDAAASDQAAPLEKKSFNEHWKDGEIGKGLIKMENGAQALWGEISGSNKKKRKKIKERIEAKIVDANQLKALVERNINAIETSLASLKQIQDELQSVLPQDFSFDDQKLLTLKQDHNLKVDDILGHIPIISVESDAAEIPCANKVTCSPPEVKIPEAARFQREQRQIAEGLAYADYARQVVKAGPEENKRERLRVIDAGEHHLKKAENAYNQGDMETGSALYEVGMGLVDIGLSLTPVVGWGKDLWEAFTGKNLVTGKNLTSFEYTMAIVGAVTVGVGGIAGDLARTGARLEALKDLVKAEEVVKEAGEVAVESAKLGGAITESEKVLNSAKTLGLKNADEIEDLTTIANEASGDAGNTAKVIENWAEAKRLGAGPQLPSNQIANFSNGKYFNRKLDTDEIFFRYHGVDNRSGRKFIYTMKREYANETSLREGVAILEEWGVTMTSKSKVRAPAGQWVSEGRAASQTGVITGEVRKGGDYQALFSMPDIPDSWIVTTGKAFP